jgi:hypothetical protein
LIFSISRMVFILSQTETPPTSPSQ